MTPIDGAMIHDITGPLAIQKFSEMEENTFSIRNASSCSSNQIPVDSLEAAKIHQYMCRFAEEQGIRNYDINEGVCHQVVLERVVRHPGRLWSVPIPIPACTGRSGVRDRYRFDRYGFCAEVRRPLLQGSGDNPGRGVGQVPETCRGKEPDPRDRCRYRGRCPDYQAIEFAGKTIAKMDMPGRMTCCNMAIEMGAKAGIVPPDKVTWDVHERPQEDEAVRACK